MTEIQMLFLCSICSEDVSKRKTDKHT